MQGLNRVTLGYDHLFKLVDFCLLDLQPIVAIFHDLILDDNQLLPFVVESKRRLGELLREGFLAVQQVINFVLVFFHSLLKVVFDRAYMTSHF